MKKYYINQKFEFFDEKKEKNMLYAEVQEVTDKVIITLSTLSHYFEERIFKSAKTNWPEKKVIIEYRGDITMHYHDFRYFKLKLLK